MTTALILLAAMALLGWLSAALAVGFWISERGRREAQATSDLALRQELETRILTSIAKTGTMLEVLTISVGSLRPLLEGTAKKLGSHDAEVLARFEALSKRLDEMPVRFAHLLYGAPGSGGDTPVSRGPAQEAEDRFDAFTEAAEHDLATRIVGGMRELAKERGVELTGIPDEKLLGDAEAMLHGIYEPAV